jgi:hypothetical protein
MAADVPGAARNQNAHQITQSLSFISISNALGGAVSTPSGKLALTVAAAAFSARLRVNGSGKTRSLPDGSCQQIYFSGASNERCDQAYP